MSIHYRKVFFAVTAALVLSGVAVHASETDERIEFAAKNSYVFKTYLKEDSIRTEAKDGIVTLTGSVKEASHRALAQDTVSSLPGVKKVENQLEYKGEQPAEHSDTWLSMKVKGVLLFNRNVSALKTQVFVNEGVVTLKGEADSQAQKDLAGEYAKDVEGIKAVNNEMTLEPVPSKPEQTLGEKIDDASITAQVKMAFLSHHSTSAFKTGVSTTDGVVTLSGDALSGAGKDMSTKVAQNINGVVRVINDMTVNP
ncbi:MAG: BON domain-containing protein [Candidatus Omnitrophica bacterium]|nr:BON domain-containing protein [Candidatus Omnitrophota bacterium]